MILKNSENNGTEEIGLVTPTPGLDSMWDRVPKHPYTMRGLLHFATSKSVSIIRIIKQHLVFDDHFYTVVMVEVQRLRLWKMLVQEYLKK